MLKLVPTRLLPRIVPADAQLGRFQMGHLGRPLLFVPVGDLQCTVFEQVRRPGVAALHLGTSAQLVFCGTAEALPSHTEHLLKEPFFRGRTLVVAASLNGGNAIQVVVQVSE